jgi:hypothetical protein
MMDNSGVLIGKGGQFLRLWNICAVIVITDPRTRG